MTATEEAFALCRRRIPLRPRHHGEGRALDQMTEADGLTLWMDGPLAGDIARSGVRSPGATDLPDELRRWIKIPRDVAMEAEGGPWRHDLWVIRRLDVVTAPEDCPFGQARPEQGGKVKHTNLTGGSDAHCGGELIKIGASALLLDGSSGRYPPRTSEELLAAIAAFRDSGYAVWYMDFDVDTNTPLRFHQGVDPTWLA